MSDKGADVPGALRSEGRFPTDVDVMIGAPWLLAVVMRPVIAGVACRSVLLY